MVLWCAQGQVSYQRAYQCFSADSRTPVERQSSIGLPFLYRELVTLVTCHIGAHAPTFLELYTDTSHPFAMIVDHTYLSLIIVCNVEVK